MYKYLFYLSVTVLCLWVSSLQAQGFSFAGCDYSQGIVFVMENDELVWQHPAKETNDIWVLENGNILFTTGRGVLEMTRQNDTVFHYQSESPIFACQRLKNNGNTFIGECRSGRLLEVAPDGKIVKEVSILPEGTADAGFPFMRNARRLDNGNYLVAHYGGQTVKEYDPAGKVVWSADVSGGPHSVIRLSNGNTLVAVADITRDPRIVELDKEGNVVWQFSNRDIEGAPLKFLGGMHLLPDGNLLFANWVGHEKEPDKRVHLLMINKEKEVVYTLKDHPALQTMSSVYCTGYKERVTKENSFH
ncbi:aryl-sulfate sulfotransferase [Parabacteroides sp. PF5-6]|uniref:beta-propeller domain-containing protein n=1 Tax=Parabacteroides sp. PF5-6 TaxID=1742403 RepID=UPI0024076CBE|nr:aryl-sulfate sulfotransferase [Parabacteroides sp. PF5-6]MDF9831720.1 outer membrane protein assembly factor BamB [Parabacteroides sp. PF5-6]